MQLYFRQLFHSIKWVCQQFTAGRFYSLSSDMMQATLLQNFISTDYFWQSLAVAVLVSVAD